MIFVKRLYAYRLALLGFQLLSSLSAISLNQPNWQLGPTSGPCDLDQLIDSAGSFLAHHPMHSPRSSQGLCETLAVVLVRKERLEKLFPITKVILSCQVFDSAFPQQNFS
jgi:hypothetical protein